VRVPILKAALDVSNHGRERRAIQFADTPRSDYEPESDEQEGEADDIARPSGIFVAAGSSEGDTSGRTLLCVPIEVHLIQYS
jgi:hypothetical protein